jgi:hypothetical protein
MLELIDDRVFAEWMSKNMDDIVVGFSAKITIQDRINRILNI